MKAELIKIKFTNFFVKNNYIKLNESPIIPTNDDSLLFTNSGMVQFKNIFLGLETSIYERVTTIQTCVRLGGKHNDLETIGKTPHHNTSFEMLGNFGLKNVTKKEAITLAWDFLTNELDLDKNKLYITIHEDDIETQNIWKNIIKFDETHIILGNNETNFWSMDETGPCGYCNELFYNIDEKNKNLLEIWNLVFIQFNKNKNNLTKLKSLYIDTGMGLERISSIKQKTYDNFQTDIYKPLINTLLKTFQISTDNINENVKIITDHIKTSILLIKNGITPANDGRGYILKKLIRRAFIKKQFLGTSVSLYELVENFIKHLNNNLYTKQDIFIIKETIKNEEIKFTKTIKNGINIIKNITKKNDIIDGKTIFMLYDTYGIPIDVIKNITENTNINFNINEFETEMDKQKIQSKKKTYIQSNITEQIKKVKKTDFTGYLLHKTTSIIIKIIKNEKPTKSILENESGIIIVDKTCFYAEKGGQIGDIGFIYKNNNIFKVTDTKEINNTYLHYGKMISGKLNLNNIVITEIDFKNRHLISINHSATHLLHATLKKQLGPHIKQSGSLITNTQLRFDFIHFCPLTKDDLTRIETIINQHIKDNLNITTKIEKSDTTNYPLEIRNVIIENDISNELCAGTHIKTTNEIGGFKIIKEFGIGTNIRRIEAITSHKIIEVFNTNEILIEQITQKFKTTKKDILTFCDNLIQKNKVLEKENNVLIFENIKYEIKNSEYITTKNNIKIISLTKNIKYINIIKNIINNLEKTILIIYSHEKDFLNININISNDITYIKALNILDSLKKYVEIKCGGKNTSASGKINASQKNIHDLSNYIYSYINTLLK